MRNEAGESEPFQFLLPLPLPNPLNRLFRRDRQCRDGIHILRSPDRLQAIHAIHAGRLTTQIKARNIFSPNARKLGRHERNPQRLLPRACSGRAQCSCHVRAVDRSRGAKPQAGSSDGASSRDRADRKDGIGPGEVNPLVNPKNQRQHAA